MKKILLSNISFFGCYGGIENSLRFLAKEYLLMGMEVLIFTGYNRNIENGSNFKRKDTLDGITHYRFMYKPFKRRLFNILFLPLIPLDILYALCLIKKENITYSVSRNQFVCFFINIFFSSINRYLAPGFSSYQSSREFLGRSGIASSIKRKIHNFFDLRAICHSSQIAVFSNNMLYQADCILKASNTKFNISNIKLFKPGVDKYLFHPISTVQKASVRKALKLPYDKKLILCVGRFVSAKGFDIAIQSMKYLGKENTTLVIVGDGDLFNEYSEMIEQNNLTDSVILVGATNKTALYYQACDYFFMSSIYEPLGQTILEAISSGLPVIAFDKEVVLTATEEILGENIFVSLPSLEPTSIATFIRKLPNVEQDIYITASNQALSLSKKYDWSVLAHNLID